MDEVAMNSDPLKDAFVYEHEAMNTTFTIRLLGMDDESARSLAQLCIEKIDQLESQLSRFMEGSDVSRINCLPDGETLYISEPCYECLLLAMDAAVQTHGLFDITLGKRIEHRKEEKDGPMPELEGRLKVHPVRSLVAKSISVALARVLPWISCVRSCLTGTARAP